MEKIVTVELCYQKQVAIESFSAPSRYMTGVMLISSTILREHTLQKVVCEWCQRVGWVPLVYRCIPAVPIKEKYRRVAFALS